MSPRQVERLGIRHVKGVLLFGPPGTGKTLIARQIGKMLNGKEPKIVNGPEVLNKFVGELTGSRVLRTVMQQLQHRYSDRLALIPCALSPTAREDHSDSS